MNKEKAKATTANVWSSTKRGFSRTKQRALDLMGKSDKIVDVQFDQEKNKFLEHYKAIEKLNKDAEKYVKLLKKISVQQAILAEDFYQEYESGAPVYNATLKNQDISKLVDQSRQQYEDLLKTEFMEPISKYMGQYKEIKDRLDQQDLRRIDVERYARDVKIYREKNKLDKLPPAEQKLDTARVNYENLTEELMKDMPALYEDRIPFFDPIVASYAISSAEFYRQCSKYTSDLLPMVSQVNRATLQDHPRVITPNEESSAHVKVAAVEERTRSLSTVTPTATVSPVASANVSPSPAPTNAARALPTPGGRAMPLPPKKVIKARGLYDFNAGEAGELGFVVGDELVILTQNGEWWEAELRGRRGLIPSNYVQLL